MSSNITLFGLQKKDKEEIFLKIVRNARQIVSKESDRKKESILQVILNKTKVNQEEPSEGNWLKSGEKDLT